MLERVIENWLTNCREREYQLGLCQVLTAEGQTILYISPHSQLEHGRDIVTVDSQGIFRGYQLKAGKGTLSQSEWQSIQKEVDQLVRFRFHHPSICESVQLQPFLVTTKRLSDPASSAIAHENELWAAAGFNRLRVIELDELVKRFMAAHGVFLPRDPADLDFFLQMYIKDGASPLDKAGLARFLASTVGCGDEDVRAADAKSAVGASVIFASYLLGKHMSARNHWAVFEGWTMTLLYALAAEEKFELGKGVLLPSVELCEIAILRALDDLWNESKSNSSNFVQGDPLVDGLFWRVRMSVLVGLASIRHFIRAGWYSDASDAAEVLAFLRRYVPESRISGEGCVPYLYIACTCLDHLGEYEMAQGTIVGLLASIIQANGSRGERGIPNTYYGIEDASRVLWGLEPNNSEVFSGGSYMSESLVHHLARRGCREALESLWQRLTFLDLRQSRPSQSWEWLVWGAKDAPLQMTRAARPQSWALLRQEAAEIDQTCLPKSITEKPYRALLLSVVMPHRFSKELAALIDRQFSKSAYLQNAG